MAVTYNVYRDDVKVKTGLTEKTHQDIELEPNTEYRYQVSAENEFGESALSPVLTVTTNYSPVTTISLDHTALELGVDEIETINATISPATANQNVTWTSSDETVALVEDGVVTTLAEGETTITATSVGDSAKTATCTVTVAIVGETPTEVSGLQSTDKTDDSVTLEWT